MKKSSQKNRSKKYTFLRNRYIILKKFVVPHGHLKMMVTIYSIHNHINYNHNHYTDGEIVDCYIRTARYNGYNVTLFINRDDVIEISDYIIDAMVEKLGVAPTNIDKDIISVMSLSHKEIINGSGLFFFNSSLDKNTKLDIVRWYKSLSNEHRGYVDTLRNEASDESAFFSNSNM